MKEAKVGGCSGVRRRVSVKFGKKTCLFPNRYRPTRTGTLEAIMNQLAL